MLDDAFKLTLDQVFPKPSVSSQSTNAFDEQARSGGGRTSSECIGIVDEHATTKKNAKGRNIQAILDKEANCFEVFKVDGYSDYENLW